jgi:integrase/recombinase XerD
MTALRQAVQEYVQMRRDLGFKLHEAGKGLVDFMRFMEQHRASHITQALAMAWAQQPSHAQPAHCG